MVAAAYSILSRGKSNLFLWVWITQKCAGLGEIPHCRNRVLPGALQSELYFMAEGPQLREAQAAPIYATQAEERWAARLRGFGPAGILAILVVLSGNALFPPISAVLALVWAHWSRTPWGELGYTRPKSWAATVTAGVVFGATFKLLMKAIVMPLLGAPAVNHTYQYLAGNRAAIPMTLWLLIAGAGFGEETIFRGFMFERLGKLFGSGSMAKAATVVITSALFGLAHYSTQGLAGTEQAAIVGLVFGSIFALTGRIWMLICAHAAFDLAAYAMIYWGIESRVAHWLFQ